MVEFDKERMAERAAELAVKKTFAIMGVDTDSPKEIEDFRRDLRFAGSLRNSASKGALAVIITFIGLIVAAAWTKLTDGEM